MKLKTKLLTILAPAAAVISLVPAIALTSCNDPSANAHIDCTNKSQTTTKSSTMIVTWTFNLKSELADGEEISISELKYSIRQHVNTKSIDIESTSGKTVTVKGTFAPGDKAEGGTYDEGNCTFYIEFTVKKSSAIVWKEKVSDLTFKFSK